MGFIAELLSGILQDIILEGVRFIGVCMLFICGQLLKLISPQRVAYSFDTLWHVKFNNKDQQLMSIEKTGQIIIGAVFLGAILAMIII